jgi:CHAT domain-containing protein
MLDEWRKLGSITMEVCSGLLTLGGRALNEGDLIVAEKSFAEARDIGENLAPGSIQTALSYINLGVVYQDSGDFAKAEANYRRALQNQKTYIPGSHYLPITLTNLGTLARDRGDLSLAIKYHQDALRAVQRIAPGSGSHANILDNLSDCFRDSNNLPKAKYYQEQALSIRRKVAPEGFQVASSLGSLGDIAQAGGELKKAEEYYRQALAIAKTLIPPPQGTADYIAGLGWVAREHGALQQSEEHYRTALKMMEQIAPHSLRHADTLAALATTIRRQGRFEEAAELYREALEDLESKSAQLGERSESRYRAKHARYYREYVDLLVQQEKPELAFETMESSRARTLFEMLARAQVHIREGVDPTLLAREHDLQQRLNAKSQYRIRLLSQKHSDTEIDSLDREIADLGENYRQVEADIRTSSPTYAALTQPQALSLKDIQALLDRETVLLEYSLGETRSFVWVVGENSLDLRELPNRATIEDLARQIYSSLTARTSNANPDPKIAAARQKQADAQTQKLAANLSEIILGPLAKLIAGKRLLVVSDGALQYIPFAALPDPDKTATPLLVEHEIINIPSASVLSEIRRASAGRSKSLHEVAVLADPVFDASDDRLSRTASEPRSARLRNISLPRPTGLLTRSASDVGLAANGSLHLNRLIYTRDEARAILALAPKGTAFQALDFAANRSTAVNPKLASYRIIHFATHGFLDSKRPELSGLVLSMVNRHGKPQDGFLGLEDVYNMKLAADLVVLSGCQTGLGEEISGEGLIGLTRGFMYAGASRVVASLWAVSDVATAELMARFYRAMEVDGMRSSAALRTAQIQMMRQNRWKSRYYWAGFQLQGEWK